MKAVSSKAVSARPVSVVPREGNHFLFGRFDLVDQLLVLLVAIVILMVNLGLLSGAWLAYWPVALILMVLKEMLQN